MTRFTVLILIIISLLTASCSGKKNKTGNEKLIPDKELVSLLVDIHITDGLLTIPKINWLASSLDSVTAYIQVIQKHGYTKEDLEKTMRYYFINDPKKINKIYNQVLSILTEMETRAVNEIVTEKTHNSGFWTGKSSYFAPSSSGNDSTFFDMSLNKPGYYTLTFSVTLYPDDQSVNPRAMLYTCNPDSLETGERRYFKSPGYIKDGSTHLYVITLPVKENKTLLLRGWLYNSDSNPYGFEKHFKIENISGTFSSVAK
jgi:hypothetical protein